jgi:hypothetical protein
VHNKTSTFLKIWNLNQSWTCLGLATNQEPDEWKKNNFLGVRQDQHLPKNLKSQLKLKKSSLNNKFGTIRMKKKTISQETCKTNTFLKHWNFIQNWATTLEWEEWNKKRVPRCTAWPFWKTLKYQSKLKQPLLSNNFGTMSEKKKTNPQVQSRYQQYTSTFLKLWNLNQCSSNLGPVKSEFYQRLQTDYRHQAWRHWH